MDDKIPAHEKYNTPPVAVMMLYTSYFDNAGAFDDRFALIGIAGQSPKNWTGLEYKKLAPSKDIYFEWHEAMKRAQNQPDRAILERNACDRYTERFVAERLGKLDKGQVIKDILVLAQGKIPVLMCYEKPGEFCHRHIVAKWLQENTGIIAEEWEVINRMEDTVCRFVVSPRIEIPITVEVSGRYVDDPHRKCFKKYADFAKGYGCYVYSIEHDDGIKIPVYIGQAHKQTLSHESLTTQKRFILTKALTKVKGGRLFVRFVVPEMGKLDKGLIDELESDLIQLGYIKNRHIENKSRIRNPIVHEVTHWSIDWDSENGKELKNVFEVKKELK